MGQRRITPMQQRSRFFMVKIALAIFESLGIIRSLTVIGP